MREAHDSARHAFVLLITRVHTSSCCVSDRPIGLVSGEVSFFACEPCERVSMNRGGMHPSTCGVGRRASSNGLGSPFFREGGSSSVEAISWRRRRRRPRFVTPRGAGRTPPLLPLRCSSSRRYTVLTGSPSDRRPRVSSRTPAGA